MRLLGPACLSGLLIASTWYWQLLLPMPSSDSISLSLRAGLRLFAIKAFSLFVSIPSVDFPIAKYIKKDLGWKTIREYREERGHAA